MKINRQLIPLYMIFSVAACQAAPVTSPTPTATTTTSSTIAPTTMPRSTIYKGPNHRNVQSSVGGNLAGLSYYSDEWVFVDQIVKGSRWIPGTRSGDNCAADWSASENWDQERNGSNRWLNSKGWPVRIPSGNCVFFSTMLHTVGKYPVGDYHLIWEGEGKISANGDVGIKRSTNGGTAVFKVRDALSPFLFLHVLETNPSNPIRNFRLIMPGGVCGISKERLNYFRYCESSSQCAEGRSCFAFKDVYFNRFSDSPSKMNNGKVVFHPTSLRTMRNYRVLRFMDWMATNHTNVKTWADRATLDYVTATTNKGVQLEYAIALANVLGADPWFSVPHTSDDNYNLQFAKLVKSNLRPGLRAYVEYSNEVWNWIFPQATYALEKGVEQKLDPDQYKAATYFYSKRSVEIFKIWSSVFGVEASKRLVRVLAGQAANVGNSKLIMDYRKASQQADAYAIAPYFGGELGTVDSTQSMSMDQLFKHLSTKSLPEAIGWIKSHSTETKQRGIRLISYEGGQHLVGIQGRENNDAITSLFLKANKDPRMGQLYTTYMKAWRSNGGYEFVHFSHLGSHSKWGAWTLLEDQLQRSSPKYNAVQKFIVENPCWWTGCARP